MPGPFNANTMKCLKLFSNTNGVRWTSTILKFKYAPPHLFSADFSVNNVDIKHRILGRTRDFVFEGPDPFLKHMFQS
jgi:hypothetical protein